MNMDRLVFGVRVVAGHEYIQRTARGQDVERRRPCSVRWLLSRSQRTEQGSTGQVSLPFR